MVGGVAALEWPVRFVTIVAFDGYSWPTAVAVDVDVVAVDECKPTVVVAHPLHACTQADSQFASGSASEPPVHCRRSHTSVDCWRLVKACAVHSGFEWRSRVWTRQADVVVAAAAAVLIVELAAVVENSTVATKYTAAVGD